MAGDPWSAAAEVAGSAINAWGQHETNKQNKEIWQKTQDWQEYMSNTAYQRSVADMKAAGLNPILAVSKGMGGGASTPGATTGAPMQNVGNSAITAALALSQLEANRAQAAKTTVDAANAATELPVRTALAQASAKGIDAATSIGTALPRVIGGWIYKADQAIRGALHEPGGQAHSARLASMSFKDMKQAGYVR